MRLIDYLEAVGETEAAFARRAQVPQQTVNRILQGKGTTVSTARKIVQATLRNPAHDDPISGTVRFEDLDPDYVARGAGDAA